MKQLFGILYCGIVVAETDMRLNRTATVLTRKRSETLPRHLMILGEEVAHIAVLPLHEYGPKSLSRDYRDAAADLHV